MCILIVLRNRVEGYPLLVGSNRDEMRDRRWSPPRREGKLLTPRDRRAGGTWIALHDDGLLVAITNRPDRVFDAHRPSRGLLALDVARTGNLAGARDLLAREIFHTPRNAFQMLLADAREAWVAIAPVRRTCFEQEDPIEDGLHTLTNVRGLDELDHRGALSPLDLPAGTTLDLALERMKACLAVHSDKGPGGKDEICKHGDDHGTLSSTIVALPDPGSDLPPVFLFASGAPCQSPFELVK